MDSSLALTRPDGDVLDVSTHMPSALLTRMEGTRWRVRLPCFVWMRVRDAWEHRSAEDRRRWTQRCFQVAFAGGVMSVVRLLPIDLLLSQVSGMRQGAGGESQNAVGRRGAAKRKYMHSSSSRLYMLSSNQPGPESQNSGTRGCIKGKGCTLGNSKAYRHFHTILHQSLRCRSFSSPRRVP